MRPALASVRRRLPDPWVLVALPVVIAIGIVLRTIGIRFGMPYDYHADEWIIAKSAMNMVREGDWNPHLYLYPSLLIDVQVVLVAIRHAVDGLTLATDQAWLYDNEILPAQFPYLLAGRLMVMSIGVATILVVYAAGRRMAGTVAGLAAAAIVAVMPLHVLHSHYLTTDVPVAFVCALTLLATVQAARVHTDRWWLVAGILAGLAASTKWNGIVVLGVPLLGWLVTSFDRHRLRSIVLSRAPWLIVGGAAAGLVVATPGIVLDTSAVIAAFQEQAFIYTNGPAGGIHESTLVFHLQALVGGVGLALVICLAGLVVASIRAWRDPSQRILIVVPAFTLAYFVIATIPPLHYERNLLPILPFLAVAGGIAADSVWKAVTARGMAAPTRNRIAVRAVAIVGVVAVLGSALVVSVASDRWLHTRDTRVSAHEWMTANVPAGTRIGRELGTPQMAPEEARFYGSFRLWMQPLEVYRRHGVAYLLASSEIYSRYVGNPRTPVEDAFYRELFALPEVFRVNAADDRPGPTIRIFQLADE